MVATNNLKIPNDTRLPPLLFGYFCFMTDDEKYNIHYNRVLNAYDKFKEANPDYTGVIECSFKGVNSEIVEIARAEGTKDKPHVCIKKKEK